VLCNCWYRPPSVSEDEDCDSAGKKEALLGYDLKE
jgi:hypothetical protein